MDNKHIVEVTEEHAKAYLEEEFADTPLRTSFGEPVSFYTLTPTTAAILASKKGGWGLELPGLVCLSTPVAKALAKHEGGSLELPGLVSLAVPVAEALAQSKAWSLSLEGLSELDAETAKELAKFKGSLYLFGLKKISDAVAAALADFKQSLYLGGLEELSKASAKSLATSGGLESDGTCTSLNLSGLEEISDGAARELGKQTNVHLYLCGIKWLSDYAAEQLSKRTAINLAYGFAGGKLELNELQNQYTYYLAADGSKWKKKKEATDAGFAVKEIEKVTKELSETALVSLARFQGEISLLGLKKMPLQAARAFGLRPRRYGKVILSKKIKLNEIEAKWLNLLPSRGLTNLNAAIHKQLPEGYSGDGFDDLQELEKESDEFLVNTPRRNREHCRQCFTRGGYDHTCKGQFKV